MTTSDKVNHTIMENEKTLDFYLPNACDTFVKYLSAVVEFHIAMEASEKRRDAETFKVNKKCKDVAMARFIEHCEKMKQNLI